MASNDNVFGVPAGLKHSWAWKFIPDAVSLHAYRATKHHILRQIDSNQPIRSIKDFVVKEPETST